MFDFMDSDAFIIGLEILFLSFIAYDAYKYSQTKKREYILNIVMAIGFALWVLLPFYTKYYEWDEAAREGLQRECLQEHNQSYCDCMDNMTYKAYSAQEYALTDKNSSDYQEFIKEAKEECFEDSWF